MEKQRFQRATNFGRLRDWVEPAHPAIVRLYDDLLAIYRIMRETLQDDVDRAFDQASRSIGFVVTTTLPAVLEFKEGKLASARMGAENLNGTIFEEKLLPIVKKWGEAASGLDLDGTYKLYVLWREALALRLRTDWMEPAHWRRFGSLVAVRPEVQEPAHWGPIGDLAAIRPEVMEPAHWFDPRLDIAIEDKLLISVIDETYADLHLAERIGGIRDRIRDLAIVPPEVQEPAHFRPGLQVREIRELLERIQEMIKGLQ